MSKVTLLLSILLLASCTPGVSWENAYKPEILKSASTPVALRPEETKCVQYDYSRNVLKVDNQFFRDLKMDFDDSAGNGVSSPSTNAPWLKMDVASLESGVDVKLVQGKIVKEIVDTTNDTYHRNVQYYGLVRVILKVTASPTVTAGMKNVLLTITDGVTPSSFPLRVEGNP